MKGSAGRRPQGVDPPLPRARKRFGQHFLTDSSALAAIVDLVEPEADDLVLEVGPGRGALTAPLLQRLQRLVAVEIDRDLVAHLRTRFEEPDLRLIEADILSLELGPLLAEEGRKRLFVVGNLPYNITAPVLFRLREHAGLVRRAVLTLQKEVAERLVATAGSRRYSQLTVQLSQCARMEIVRHIPSSAFRPQPKVDSAVLDIHFVPQRIPVDDMRRFEILVKAAFGQRRKMLRNALQSLPGLQDDEASISTADLAALAASAEIDLTQRAEDLSVGQFARLAAAMGNRSS